MEDPDLTVRVHASCCSVAPSENAFVVLALLVNTGCFAGDSLLGDSNSGALGIDS